VRSPLIHIGYNKTGSTWLQREFFPLQAFGFKALLDLEDRKRIYRYLVAEHDLYYMPDKVLTYCAHRLCGEEELLPVLSAERFSGDPHSGGYDSVRIAERLHGLFPDSRILIVVREQRSMILSTYTQYVRAGGVRSLRRYFHPPERGSRRLPQFDFRYFDYAPLVECYINLFGKEQVKVLPYEWLSEAPERFLREILSFAGLFNLRRAALLSSLPFGKRVNEGYGPFSLRAKRWYNRFFLENALHPGAPFPLPEGIERRAVSLFQKADALLPSFFARADRQKRMRFIERFIGQRYAEGNARLAELAGLDLKALGYV